MTAHLPSPRLLLLVVAVALLGGCQGSNVGISVTLQRRQTAELQELLDKVRAEVGAPGALLGVEDKQGDLTVLASGFADRDAGRPMAPDAPYFLGSISKTYTAVTVLRLAEEGRLSLDDTVARFLPSFPRGNEIAVRQLLGHTSGLKDFYMYLYYRPDRKEMTDLVTKEWTQDELLALAGRFGHWFEPGTDWSYSSTNYFLLGVIIEKAGGEPLPQAYRRFLYQRLALDQTWLAWHEDAKGALPTGYLGPVEGWKHSAMFGDLGPTTVLDRSPVEWGAGGLAAPAEDALRFLHGLFAGEILKPASLAAMTQFRATPQLGVAESGGSSEDGYGLGLVRMRRAGFTLLGHGGLFTGHTAGLWHLPDCGLTIALYFNRGFVNQRAALDQIVPAMTSDSDGSTRCEPGPGG